MANRIRRGSRRQLHGGGPISWPSCTVRPSRSAFQQHRSDVDYFVASSLAIWLAYAYVNKSIEKAELDGFNRQMGALVGAVLGVLLVMVITLFSVSLLGKSAHDSIFQSKLGPYVIRGISMAQAFVPGDFQASLDPHFETFYQQIGHDGNQLPGTFTGFNQNAVPGGSQYSNGQTFTPGAPGAQTTFDGNWSTSSPDQQTQNNFPNNGYPNGGYPNNGYQPSQTQTGYPPAGNNQGVNYPPQPPQQQQPQQQQPSPGFQINLDAENLINGAGQLFNSRFSNP